MFPTFYRVFSVLFGQKGFMLSTITLSLRSYGVDNHVIAFLLIHNIRTILACVWSDLEFENELHEYLFRLF